jgi:oligoribonuclease NrnB/cAMP/cGMP phosphodiesterase (DHH superfamily)
VIIIYHANCCDGFCGAWLLSKLYPDAEFMPFQHGTPAPLDQLKSQDVILVDFCFPHDEMIGVMSLAQTLRVFDHHKSVPEELRQQAQFIYDESESGCSLVWNYFREELLKSFPASAIDAFSRTHWVVEYVKDRDLWRWKLPHSQEVNAGISLAGWDFAEWDKLMFHKCLNEGATIKRYRDLRVASTAKRAINVVVETDERRYIVPCVNETNGDFISHVGEALAGTCETTPFGMTYFHRLDATGRHEYVFSLRSRNGLDVSKVAQHFGGGGHPGAAGFTRKSFFELA